METKLKLTNGHHHHHQHHERRNVMNGHHPETLSIDDILTNGFKSSSSKKRESERDVNLNERAEPASGLANGPNQVAPAADYSTSSPDGRVKLWLGESGTEAEAPLSVPGLFNRTVTRYPDTVAMAAKSDDGLWRNVTYREYQQMVFTCAKGFIKLGLERLHSVAILGFNGVEWFVSDLAAVHAGGIAVGIYTTNSPEACHHVLSNSRANIAVVQDAKQMEKIRAVWHRLPELKAVVQWEGRLEPPLENVYTWSELMKIGAAETNAKLTEALQAICINECCTLVYTSGTVGQPKGTMLSHDNLVWEAHSISERVRFDPGNERMVSYLPLSHVAAQMVDIYMTIYNAISIYFGDKDALKGSLVKTLQEVRPTKFIGVPRVWEKMHEKLVSIGASSGAVKKLVGGWAKQKSLDYYADFMKGVDRTPRSYKFAKLLVLNKVKAALGFDRCNLFITAAAPLALDVKRYFLSLDIPVTEAFGMSEVSGAHCVGVMSERFRIDSVGKPLDGVETKLHNADPSTGEGEICFRGRHMFMGYVDEPDKTQEAIDAEGWLHSGDTGTIDDNGFLYVTGRLKELLITAGGENVAPVPIEQHLKAFLAPISQAMVIGDRRKYLSVLLTFKSDVDHDSGAPLDRLTDDVKAWAQRLGCSSITTVTQLKNTKDEKILKAIQTAIDKTNDQAISNAQKIQKFAILPADFSIVTGELGPTMKIKRNVVVDKYAAIIDGLYSR